MSDVPTTQFQYEMLLECRIDGRVFEFHKTFKHPAQFCVGDIVYINNLEEVEIAKIVWMLDEPGSALMELKDRNCQGVPSDWTCLLRDMDYSSPELL